MYNVIVKLDDKAGFIKVDEHNFIITPDIQEASKFIETGRAIDGVLQRVREHYSNDKFVTSKCPSNIFGNKPRNVISENKILKDKYFELEL